MLGCVIPPLNPTTRFVSNLVGAVSDFSSEIIDRRTFLRGTLLDYFQTRINFFPDRPDGTSQPVANRFCGIDEPTISIVRFQFWTPGRAFGQSRFRERFDTEIGFQRFAKRISHKHLRREGGYS